MVVLRGRIVSLYLLFRVIIIVLCIVRLAPPLDVKRELMRDLL